MKTPDELIQAIQSPQIAPFKVTFELFSSPNRKRIANAIQTLKEYESLLLSFVENGQITAERAHELIGFRKDQEVKYPAHAIIERFATHLQRFERLKTYFNQKIELIGLVNPLIFFDDEAQRIDLGYGPKQTLALFPDFFDGLFVTDVLLNISLFSPSPYEIFSQDFITQEYQVFLNALKADVFSNAKATFESLEVKKRQAIKLDPSHFHEAELIKRYLESYPGFIVGEVHSHQSPKHFLIDNMPLLKMQGVSIIYMEHLFKESHQIWLDEYFSSDFDAQMPKELKIYLNYLDHERRLSGAATFTAVVEVAKQHQIRVVAIDSEAIYGLGYAKSIHDLFFDKEMIAERYKAMNMSMLERYREFNDGQKFIVFVGSGHVSTCLDVPGVSDLLNCPNIVVNDLDVEREEYVQQNIDYGNETQKTVFDILYHRHPIQKPAHTFDPVIEIPVVSKDSLFNQNKLAIQEQYLEKLKILCKKMCSQEDILSITIIKHQEFFSSLSVSQEPVELRQTIINFRQLIQTGIDTAKQLMSHGLAYRIAEACIKVIAGVVISLLMLVAALIGQGMLESAHRKQFADTFFRWHHSKELKALEEFQNEVLGDGNQETGLISYQRLSIQ